MSRPSARENTGRIFPSPMDRSYGWCGGWIGDRPVAARRRQTLRTRHLTYSEHRHMASPIVTIDGPSGSGKGTISRAVARHAGWHLLDSGALYRLAALAGAQAGLDPQDIKGH